MNEPRCQRCAMVITAYDLVIPVSQARRAYENGPLYMIDAGYVHLSCVANPYDEED